MGLRISWREHRQSDGTTTLYARFAIPERQADGTIGRRHVERSTGTGRKAEARLVAERIYQEEWEKAHAPVKDQIGPRTFAAAAVTYMRTTGVTRFLHPIIERIGLTPLDQIDQAVVAQLADELYPGRSAATVNRQVYTPIVAVLTMAADDKLCAPPNLKRPRGHDSLPQLDVPEDGWYPAVLRAANPWLRAFLIVGRLHGRRPGELLNRTREHFNPELGTLLIRDNKGDQNILLQLAGPAQLALKALPDLRTVKKGSPAERLTPAKRNYLFGTNRKETMREWLKDACQEAGVRYHMPKEAGRHAFVTKNLEAGKSLKWVQDAGRWKTLKVVAEKYGHLERQEVDKQARQAGEAWFEKVLSQPVMIEADVVDATALPVATKRSA